jgi:hypothetical protein
MWTLISDLPTGNERQSQIDGNRVPLIWTQPINAPNGGNGPNLGDQIPPIEYIMDSPVDFQTFTFTFGGDAAILWTPAEPVSSAIWVLELDCITGV